MKDTCVEALRSGDENAVRDTAKCFQMTEVKRWRGLWLDGFEGQLFCPAPAITCAANDESSVIWITFPNNSRPTGNEATHRTYAIEFTGRRTLLPGQHGYAADHEMLVDKLISIRRVTE